MKPIRFRQIYEKFKAFNGDEYGWKYLFMHRDRKFSLITDITAEHRAGGGFANNGKYGVVFSHPDSDYVIKFFYNDDQYKQYLRYIKDKQSPYFPKILFSKNNIVPNFMRSLHEERIHVVVIEKLYPLDTNEIWKFAALTDQLKGYQSNKLGALNFSHNTVFDKRRLAELKAQILNNREKMDTLPKKTREGHQEIKKLRNEIEVQKKEADTLRSNIKIDAGLIIALRNESNKFKKIAIDYQNILNINEELRQIIYKMIHDIVVMKQFYRKERIIMSDEVFGISLDLHLGNIMKRKVGDGFQYVITDPLAGTVGYEPQVNAINQKTQYINKLEEKGQRCISQMSNLISYLQDKNLEQYDENWLTKNYNETRMQNLIGEEQLPRYELRIDSTMKIINKLMAKYKGQNNTKPINK